MGEKRLELNYDLFEKLCDGNEIPDDKLLDFLETGRIIVEPVSNSSSLDITARKSTSGKTTNYRLENIRFNIKKLVKSLPSLILDIYGLYDKNCVKTTIRAVKIINTSLSLFSIQLEKDEGNLLYALWRMDGWGKDISWEIAFTETNKMLKELGEELLSEDKFCAALESLSNYLLIELSDRTLNKEDVKNTSIELLDHLLIENSKN